MARTQAKRVPVVGLIAVLAVSGLAHASSAGAGTPGPTAGVLPAVTFDKTTWRAGDQVTVTGTGCLDPDTGTGTGLTVIVNRTISRGRGGNGPLQVIEATVEADGSFTGTGTIEQPMTPEGSQDVSIYCGNKGAGLLAGVATITVVAPSLPSLTVQAGEPFTYVMPCSIESGGYGYFGFGIDAQHGFGLRGRFPYDLSAKKGDSVSIEVPADTPVGVFDATAGCSVDEAGTSAYFAHFTITVKAAAVAPAPVVAKPAAPVPGVAHFTG